MPIKFSSKKFYNNFFKDQLVNHQEEAGDPENSLKYLQKLNLPKNYKILDIGTHIGTLPHKLIQIGYQDVWGVDISELAIYHGQEKYPELKEKLIGLDNDSLPFSDNTFDVILMFDVIEHIQNIDEFLKKEVFRILKNDGTLVFQTPNKLTNVIWTLFSTKNIKKTISFIKYDHCSLQTLPSLKRLLYNSGFTNTKIEKNYLRNEYDKNKIIKKIGSLFLFLLPLFKISPLAIFPNFWGTAKKNT